MYRIYDHVKMKWLNDGSYVLPNGNLVKVAKGKLISKRQREYTYNEYDYQVDLNTGFADKFGKPIYENDILEVGNYTGVVAWHSVLGEYILLVPERKEWFPLWAQICEKYAKAIGNLEESKRVNDEEIIVSKILKEFNTGTWTRGFDDEYTKDVQVEEK